MNPILRHDATTDPLRQPLASSNNKQLPEFLRLPRAGSRCPVTGLSRATINALILGDNPSVKSICLRRRGSARGIRLVVTISLLEFLYQQTGVSSTAQK